MRKSNDTNPSLKAQTILGWADTPKVHGPQTITLETPDGEQSQITLKDGNLRILLAMAKGPVYCASPVRISDRVLILKRDYGVNIETTMHKARGNTPCERFGIYTLLDRIVGPTILGADNEA